MFCHRYGRRWDVIEQALAVEPSCVLALVFAADYEVAKYVGNPSFVSGQLRRQRVTGVCVCMHIRERMDKAKQHLKRAHEIVSDSPELVTAREQFYVDAYQAWMSGDLTRAYSGFKKVAL